MGKMTEINERMETLKNYGVDTSKFFRMSLDIPMGASVELKINGEDVALPCSETNCLTPREIKLNESTGDMVLRFGSTVCDNDNQAIKNIIEGGYVNNPRLFRRWICSQVLRMIEWKSYNGRESGYDACLRAYGYNYQFRATIDELHRIVRMQQDGDPMATECLHFFNKDVVVAMLEDYLRKLKRYIKNARNKRKRTYNYKEYVKLSKYGNVFIDDLDCNVYKNIEEYINIIKSSNSLKSIEHTLSDFMHKAYNKLPDNTAMCPEFKTAYKANGAYFTLANLVMFHNNVNQTEFKIQSYETGEIMTRGQARKYLTSLLDVYKGNDGWKFMELLKKSLELNNFDLNYSISLNANN